MSPEFIESRMDRHVLLILGSVVRVNVTLEYCICEKQTDRQTDRLKIIARLKNFRVLTYILTTSQINRENQQQQNTTGTTNTQSE
jgi:hypothetical protein